MVLILKRTVTNCNLMAFLKRRSDGYTGRKSKVLSPADVEKFLNEAPDSQYLATKVRLIFLIVTFIYNIYKCVTLT